MKEEKYYKVFYNSRFFRNMVFGVKGVSSQQRAILKTHLFTTMAQRNSYMKPKAYLITKEEFEEMGKPTTQDPNIVF